MVDKVLKKTEFVNKLFEETAGGSKQRHDLFCLRSRVHYFVEAFVSFLGNYHSTQCHFIKLDAGEHLRRETSCHTGFSVVF